jgi:hypothetical protein
MMYFSISHALRYAGIFLSTLFLVAASQLNAGPSTKKTSKEHGQHIIQICHYEHPESETAEVISINIDSLEEHLAHGDSQEVINCPVQCTPRCDDNNACTIDLCDERKNCLPIEERPTLNCDDFNSCTLDFCDAETGCFNIPNTCNDNIACTADSCDQESDPSCIHVPNDAACDDSNSCTFDSCELGVGCTYQPNTCNDNITCTIDSCDPESDPFCSNIPDNSACDDHIACTRDICDPESDPSCLHVPDNPTCDDNDPCTVDICDASVGCRYEPNTCDDGNIKTCDQCIAGVGCQYVDLSSNCTAFATCNDNVPIYDAQCNFVDCQFMPVFEGSSCLPFFPDTCKSYTCQSGFCNQTGSAPDGISCSSFGGIIAGPCVELSKSCQSGTCLQTKKPDGILCNTSCSDTNTEVCSDGACIPAIDGNSQPIPLCLDITYDPCNLTETICAVINGFATCGYITGDCADFNNCTNDSCDINTAMCQYIPITPEANCDDGNVCTDDEASCDQLGGVVCTHTFDASNDTVCQGAFGPCLAQGNDCNDNDACTIDSCNAGTGQCSHVFDLSPSNKLCINCNSNADCNPSQYAAFLPTCTTSWTGACMSNKCKFTPSDSLCPWTNKCSAERPKCTVNGCSQPNIKLVVLKDGCYKYVCDPATGITSHVQNTSKCPEPNDCCYAPDKSGDGKCFSPCGGVGCLLAESLCDGTIF